MNRNDIGVCAGRAHDDAEDLARERDVVGIPAGTGDEPFRLHARDGLTDSELHRVTPFFRSQKRL